MSCWTPSRSGAGPPDVARHATIIGEAVDVWGDWWEVREERQTTHGFALALGWPAGVRRGRGAAGGVRVIVTTDLAAHLESTRMAPAAHGLPIGNTTVKRLRRLLGHHWQIDRAAWWEERADDLTDLTIEAFATRHAVSVGAVVNARHALFGPALRPAGWWRAPDVAAVILADAPRADIAARLEISVGSVGRLRWALRATPPAPR